MLDVFNVIYTRATSAYVSETVHGAVRRCVKKSRIAPWNAIMMMMMMMMMMMIIIILLLVLLPLLSHFDTAARHIPIIPISYHCCYHNCTATTRRWLLLHPSPKLTLPHRLFVGCLTSQQQASVSQGWICSDNFTCFHTEIEAADQTFYLTQSQYTDTGPTTPSVDPIMPDAWQGSHWSANFEVAGMTRPRKNPATSEIRTRDLPLSRRTPYR